MKCLPSLLLRSYKNTCFVLFLEELSEMSLQKYVCLHVNCLIRFLDFIKTWIFLVCLTKSPSGSRVVCAEEQREDSPRDMTKLVVALGNFRKLLSQNI